jgi:hypothetical protein
MKFVLSLFHDVTNLRKKIWAHLDKVAFILNFMFNYFRVV